MNFAIGPGVECDLEELIISRLLVQANSGAGKSWTLRRILEQTFGQVQHIVFDRDGEFVSLRERFDYVLAARTGGDTVAEPRAAKLLARRLLELGASAILDISELHSHERAPFVRLFLEAMLDAPKKLWHPCFVVIDEVEQFCPEGATGSAESAKAIEDLQLLGRKRGYCGILATKRLARLRKSAAYECNNKLIGRCMLDDAKRAADELGFGGREGWQQFRQLDRGEFFAFGPALTKEAQRVRVGPVATTHPEAGQGMRFVVPPPTEKVRRLLPQLADLPAEAEQERQTLESLRKDNADLRRRMTLAEKERTAPPLKPAPPDESLIERRVAAAVAPVQREAAAQRTKYERVIGRAADGLEKVVGELRASLNGRGPDHGVGETETRSARAGAPSPAADGPRAAPRAHPVAVVTPDRRRRAPADLDDAAARDLTGPEQRILDALAWWEAVGVDAPGKGQIGFIAGYRVSKRVGGTFGNYLGMLRARSLIDYPNAGAAQLTAAGRAAAHFPPAMPTLEALHDAIYAKLDGPEERVLRVLVECYPDALNKQEAGELAGYQVGPRVGGTFGNYLGSLRSLGLADYPSPGLVAATTLLFPESLA